jgi:hypothetical protein
MLLDPKPGTVLNFKEKGKVIGGLNEVSNIP